MKKKLALACSLIHEPQVVMLDEPTLGVDPVSRREFWNLLGNLRTEKGMTIFVCTPYMDEAERCSRMGLMYRGQMVVCDTPERIKSMTRGELIALRPSDLRRAREMLAGLAGVLEMQTFGDQLRVFTENADAVMARARPALAAQGIELFDVRRVQPRMEEAFISLVRSLDQQ